MYTGCIKPRFLTRVVCNLGSWVIGFSKVRVQTHLYAYFAEAKSASQESSCNKTWRDMTDVAILDECRTIVPSGYVGKNIDTVTTKLMEIDRTEPFTWAFTQIKRIPFF